MRPSHTNTDSCCHKTKSTNNAKKTDWFFIVLSLIVALFYTNYLLIMRYVTEAEYLEQFSVAVYQVVNQMWWGVLLGILMLAILSKIPRQFVMSILGQGNNATSILRATIAGILLDLCSHGILMVGAKLYERGASIGQVMAFLIASPWNSFSLTLILIALIGIYWTLAFILLSFIIAFISGIIFNILVNKGILPENPNKIELEKDFNFFNEAKSALKNARFQSKEIFTMLKQGISEARIVLRWLLFGIVLVAIIRTFVDPDIFKQFLGPSFLGLIITLFMATIIEVCSEGTVPMAADIVNRASAPGGGFAFMMAGVSTDYTEIMVLKETTHSWKIALFLPLVTLPQIILLSWLMNQI